MSGATLVERAFAPDSRHRVARLGGGLLQRKCAVLMDVVGDMGAGECTGKDGECKENEDFREGSHWLRECEVSGRQKPK